MKIIPNTKYYTTLNFADKAVRVIVFYFIVRLLIKFFQQMPVLSSWNFKDYFLTLMEFGILLTGGFIIWAFLIHTMILLKKIIAYLIKKATA